MSRGHSKLCFHLSMVMSVLILSMLSPAQKTQTPGTSTLNDEELLLLIKQKTGGYCERLKAVALHFVCHENMHENVYNYGKRSTYSRSNLTGEMIYATQLQLRNVKEKTYVYDYQMVRDGEKKQEQRTLIQENGKKKNKKDAKLQLQRYYAQYLVYGPVGFFSFSWQPEFEYALLGREETERHIMPGSHGRPFT